MANFFGLKLSFEQTRFNFPFGSNIFQFIWTKCLPNLFLQKEFKLISNCNLCSSRLKCAICLGFVCFFIDLSLARKQNSKFQIPNYKFNLFVHVNKVDRIMVLGLVRTDSICFDWFFQFQYGHFIVHDLQTTNSNCVYAAWDVILGNLSWP